MLLTVNKLALFRAFDDLSRYVINAKEFGERVVGNGKYHPEIWFLRNGRKVINDYIGMTVKEYRCRGFRLSQSLGFPLQHHTITCVNIDIKTFFDIFERQGFTNQSHPFQKFFLWSFLDIQGKPRYVLHLQYALDREPDFYLITLPENFTERFPINPDGNKRLRRFVDWLNYYQ